MASITQKLVESETLKLDSSMRFVPHNVVYETMMGSTAYGVSNDTSDMDIYGICIPPKEYLFPNLQGVIRGFGNQGKVFEQLQEHHIHKQDEGRVYDLNIYNIAKFFNLAMGCNPNIIDSLFTPADCLTHCSAIGNMIRENRHLFLSKRCFATFKGYAYGEMAGIAKRTKETEEVINFETSRNLDRSTTMEDIKAELQKRGIAIN